MTRRIPLHRLEIARPKSSVERRWTKYNEDEAQSGRKITFSIRIDGRTVYEVYGKLKCLMRI